MVLFSVTDFNLVSVETNDKPKHLRTSIALLRLIIHTLMLNSFSQPTTLWNRVADKELTVAQLVMKFFRDLRLYLMDYIYLVHKNYYSNYFRLEVGTDMKRRFLKTLRSVPTMSEEMTVRDE